MDFYVIYKNPSDYPGNYVLRKHTANNNGSTSVSEEAWVSKDLEKLRQKLPQGLYRMKPMQGDDPVILETYI